VRRASVALVPGVLAVPRISTAGGHRVGFERSISAGDALGAGACSETLSTTQP
jgi:hypothetical protein